MKKLSIVILAHNEENTIIDCLESVSFSDEIIVIDDFSTDRTYEIASAYQHPAIKIFKRHLDDDFATQRNYGLSKTSFEWVLFVDADERVSESLKNEIHTILSDKKNTYDGYKIRRADILWGKSLLYGEVANIHLVRLGKKDKGLWFGFVHEEWDIKGRVGILKNILLHYPHQSIKEFLAEVNYYTDIRAKELASANVGSSFFSILLYPLGKFLQNYFFRQGFRDGTEGFVIAMIMSLHSFLVRSKLYMFSRSQNSI